MRTIQILLCFIHWLRTEQQREMNWWGHCVQFQLNNGSSFPLFVGANFWWKPYRSYYMCSHFFRYFFVVRSFAGSYSLSFIFFILLVFAILIILCLCLCIGAFLYSKCVVNIQLAHNRNGKNAFGLNARGTGFHQVCVSSDSEKWRDWWVFKS